MTEKTLAKHSVKIQLATLATIILFVVAMSMQFATWKTKMEATHQEFDDRITHIGEKVVGMRSDINILKEKANDRDIELAKINTKLTNIETLLIEIKQDLKNSYN